MAASFRSTQLLTRRLVIEALCTTPSAVLAGTRHHTVGAWFDDGTHTVVQHVTLVYEGQVAYERTTGKRPNGNYITCGGRFPWNNDVATITVGSTIQHQCRVWKAVPAGTPAGTA